MSEGPVRLRDALNAFGARLGFDAPVETGLIWSRWEEIVGPTIVAHAEPTSLRDGTLRVRAESPVWATEISYLAEEIRRRANQVARVEVVREVRIWTGPGAIKRARSEAAATAPETAPDAGPRAAEADPESAFRRARAAWARRAGKRRETGSRQGAENREKRR